MDLTANAWPVITTAVSSLTLVALGVMRLLKSFRSIHQEARQLRQELRKHVTLIGIPAGTRVPLVLKPLPDFIQVKDAVLANVPFAVLHTRTLSYALRHCDFVCYRTGSDPAIHTEDSPFWSDLLDAKSSDEDRSRDIERASRMASDCQEAFPDDTSDSDVRQPEA